jgi:glucosamine--fructose-6-phosphate aminotransferase (isomerizing)
MCGIIGYIGKREAFPVLLSGLKRMEYRGYDSFGFCLLDDDKKPFLFKKVGKISNAEKDMPTGIKGHIGQGHTRWATMGAVTETNAHPHTDCKKEIFVSHNGIIENYQELRAQLEKEGHKFVSQCDSEVLPHLIEKYFQGNLEEAVRHALRQVRGTYGIVTLSTKDSDKLVAARFSSPLLLGVNGDEFIVASDPAAIITHTRQVINMDDGEIAVIKPDDFFILKEKPMVQIEWAAEDAEKSGYEHFMLKEIMEEPQTIENAFRGRLMPEEGRVKLGGLDIVADRIKNIERLILIGCGTAHYAARVGKYMLEEYAGIPTEVDVASEFRYRKPILAENTAAIFISQSGETADTLAALREMKEKGILALGVTNAVGSSQARESDAGVYTRSGPEMAVASTKAFIGQLATLALLTVYLGRQRDMAVVMGKRIIEELSALPELAQRILKSAPQIEELVQKYKPVRDGNQTLKSGYTDYWFIGRKYNYPIAMEGALKLKEITYLHAEGVAGGELKHGPLALVDETMPTVAICPSDSVYEKILSNVEEVRARKGRVMAIATEGNDDIKKTAQDVIYIPKTLEMLTPMLSVIPLHLFSYYMAVVLGRDVDKPRNLAKSVTVE